MPLIMAVIRHAGMCNDNAEQEKWHSDPPLFPL